MESIERLVPGFLAALESVPGTLQAHRRLQRVLEGGILGTRVRSLIGLAVASQFQCDYSAWVHARLAESSGLGGEDIAFACAGSAVDRREAAIARLAMRMVCGGRLMRKVDVDARDAGLLKETEVAEVAAHVAFTILNCYVLQGLSPARSGATRTRRAV